MPAVNIPLPGMGRLPLPSNLASLGQGLQLPNLGTPSAGSTIVPPLGVPAVPGENPLAALNPLSALP
jgi:hypothetical protein